MRRALVLGALAVFAALVPVRRAIAVDRARLPADGRATARVRLSYGSVVGLSWPARSAALEVQGASAMRGADGTWVVRAPSSPAEIALAWGSAAATIDVVPDPRDADEDGIPDAAELIGDEDRAAFTAWFTAIAEAQAKHIDDAWAPVHRDCAGLVRFAFKEALRAHDAEWRAKHPRMAKLRAPDVRALRYPSLPLLGDRPFRAVGGRFDPAQPIDATFTAAPSARALWQHNSALVSRDVSDARPGDLLFYAVPHAPGSGMHTMIALGTADRVDRVVYHTGEGEVRVVALADLAAHPDPGWHPAPHNARFLGVHRLHHLHHATRAFAALGDQP